MDLTVKRYKLTLIDSITKTKLNISLKWRFLYWSGFYWVCLESDRFRQWVETQNSNKRSVHSVDTCLGVTDIKALNIVLHNFDLICGKVFLKSARPQQFPDCACFILLAARIGLNCACRGHGSLWEPFIFFRLDCVRKEEMETGKQGH